MERETNIQTKLLTEAGRQVLRPMGLVQKGRSRIWLDDRVWWVGVVEFQPSGFSKGSYLNVGCMWLWHVHAHIAYSEVERISDFSPFESEQQFRPIADALASDAATAVSRYRALFSSVSEIWKRYPNGKPRLDFWRAFDAGIASALSGKPELAAELFGQITEPDASDFDWLRNARFDAQILRIQVNDLTQFRGMIVERISQTRELLKLPPVSEISFPV